MKMFKTLSEVDNETFRGVVLELAEEIDVLSLPGFLII